MESEDVHKQSYSILFYIKRKDNIFMLSLSKWMNSLMSYKKMVLVVVKSSLKFNKMSRD